MKTNDTNYSGNNGMGMEEKRKERKGFGNHFLSLKTKTAIALPGKTLLVLQSGCFLLARQELNNRILFRIP